MRLGLRTRDFLLISVLTLAVVTTTSAVYIGHVSRLALENTQRSAKAAANAILAVADRILAEAEAKAKAKATVHAPQPDDGATATGDAAAGQPAADATTPASGAPPATTNAPPGEAGPAKAAAPPAGETVPAPAAPTPAAALESSAQLQSLADTWIGGEQEIVYVGVVDTGDHTLVASGTLPDPDAVVALGDLLSFGTVHRLWVLYHRGQLAELAVPILRDKAPFGTIRVGVDTRLVRGELNGLLGEGASLLLFGALASWLVALLIARFSRRPLQRLALQIDRLRGGEWEFELEGWDRDVRAVAERLTALGRQMRSERLAALGQKATLEQIMNHIENGILLVDRGRRVAFCNHACLPLLPCALHEATDRPLAEMLGDDHPLCRLLTAADDDGRDLENLPCRLTPSGPFHESLVSVFGVRHGSEPPSGWVLLLEDLGSFRILQDLTDVGSRMAELSTVTAEVVHDVKNPLHAMRLRLHLLEHEMKDGSPRARECVGSLHEQLSVLDRMIGGFLDFLRAGLFEPAPLDLAAVLQEVVAQARDRAAASGITVTLQAPPSLPLAGHRQMLQRAFQNVVGNAIEAMAEGGRVQVTATLDEQNALVTIEDDGPGMPAAVRERVFQLYFTTKASGSGIGLPLVRRVVTEHGGSLELDSEPGRGTRVVVRLPVALPGVADTLHGSMETAS